MIRGDLMQSRVERFKAYREEIALNDKKVEVERIIVTDEVIDQQNIYASKKNTLAMSIDQIIEAHDEYTLNIEHERILQEEKLLRNKKIKKIIIKWLIIGLSVACLITIATIILINVL